jgi:hypothetical protein
VATHLHPFLPCGPVCVSSPAGSGSILSVVTEDGSLALLDVCQPLAVRPSFNARQSRLREVLSTPSAPAALTHNAPGHIPHHTPPDTAPAAPPAAAAGDDSAAASVAGTAAGAGAGVAHLRVPVVLLSPGPLGSSMLLKQPWVLLLRFLLQVGGWGGEGRWQQPPEHDSVTVLLLILRATQGVCRHKVWVQSCHICSFTSVPGACALCLPSMFTRWLVHLCGCHRYFTRCRSQYILLS